MATRSFWRYVQDAINAIERDTPSQNIDSLFRHSLFKEIVAYGDLALRVLFPLLNAQRSGRQGAIVALIITQIIDDGKTLAIEHIDEMDNETILILLEYGTEEGYISP